MLTRDEKSKNGSSLNYNHVTNSAATLRMEIQHGARLGLRWAGMPQNARQNELLRRRSR